jgi:predicted transcriptional regulator
MRHAERAGEPAPPEAPTLDALFQVLASPHRLRFLRELQRAPLTASQLARETGLSVQEGMRHLGRLQDVKLAERRGGRGYALTAVGQLVVDALPYFEALALEPGFFLDHDVGFIPPHLRRAELMCASRAKGSESENVLAMENMMFASRRFLYRASTQLFLDGLPSHRPAPGQAAVREWLAVYTPDAVAVERFLRLPETLAPVWPGLDEMRIRVALLPDLPFMLSVNEHEAHLFLRSHTGRLDLREPVRSREPGFRAWAVELFRAYESLADVAFDTARGDTLGAWRERILAAVERTKVATKDAAILPPPR